MKNGNRSFRPIAQTALLSVALLGVAGAGVRAADSPPSPSWRMGSPIVSYWCGPVLTDAAAQQMKDGGWNVVWCDEKSLEVAQRHGLRAQIQSGLLSPGTLADAKTRGELDAFIERVKTHPALYAYYITDEPSAGQFADLGKLVAYLRERDPAHLAYINLFPTYANNQQLGTSGDTVTAYQEHLRQYLEIVKPSLISYDHYQFSLAGDNPEYFLNLAMIRRAALNAGVPFLNIVQASTWAPQVMRVPGPDEMRYLVYTTLAYGGQGISYYIYSCPNHLGGIANADGSTTVLYDALKVLNREFVAIASELQPLRSLGAYHAGMLPPGAELLPPVGTPFRVVPPLPTMEFRPPEPVRGVLIGLFGPADGKAPSPTHAVVVNLDYRKAQLVGVDGPGALAVFDPGTRAWITGDRDHLSLQLPGGGGKLIRRTAAK